MNNIKAYSTHTCAIIPKTEFKQKFIKIFGEYDPDDNCIDVEFDSYEGVFFCGISTNKAYEKLSEYFGVTIHSICTPGANSPDIYIIYD
ncbi:hypothetical protein J6A31_04905 [bacterium]|nr:hypothetical protein [bacterium]